MGQTWDSKGLKGDDYTAVYAAATAGAPAGGKSSPSNRKSAGIVIRLGPRGLQSHLGDYWRNDDS